jgi:nitroreductase
MDFKDVINKRRAVNFFDSEKSVSGELLREMVEMAAKAPSSFNLQP